MRTIVIQALAVTLALATPAAAQSALPMGSPSAGSATDASPTLYTFNAASAGVLTVAVDGSGDLVLRLRDATGQLMPDGSSDQDLNGSTGTEILAVTIGRPGAYQVEVSVFGGGSSQYQIAGAFMAFPPFEMPADADGSPDGAIALPVGEGRDDSLDTSKGDAADWFVLTPSEDATLAVVTRSAGTEIDLQIEVFLDGNFSDPVDQSDQDQQGDTANEAVTVSVKAGQQVHVRVSGVMGNAVGPYRISSSLITAAGGV